MKTEWYSNKPIVSILQHIDPNSPYAHIDYPIQVLEDVQTPYCKLLIAFNPEFGNMMFIDGEVQICEKDMDAYHKTMFGAVKISPKLNERVLIVGDGDGGFTKFGDYSNIDLVERDPEIMKAGTKYFGAQWDKVNWQIVNLQDYIPEQDGQIYDAIILAVDDEFNLLPDFEEHLNRVLGWLKPGGRIVAQVATSFSYDDEKHFQKYIDKYKDNFSRYANWSTVNNMDYTFIKVYISCFRGFQNFFVGVKS